MVDLEVVFKQQRTRSSLNVVGTKSNLQLRIESVASQLDVFPLLSSWLLAVCMVKMRKEPCLVSALESTTLHASLAL